MDSRTGRPLRLWGGILVIWIMLRLGLPALPGSMGPSAPLPQPNRAEITTTPFAAPEDIATSDPLSGNKIPALFPSATMPANGRRILLASSSRQPPLPTHLPTPLPPGSRPDGARAQAIWPASARPLLPPPLSPDNAERGGRAAAKDPAIGRITIDGEVAKKWQIYAFSFWRLTGGGPAGLASAAQYGGSQSGIIATYRVGGGEKSDLSLLARVTITPQNTGDRELAAGLSWRPARNIPVKLFAEYRARAPAPDAAALYLAGSVPDIALPGGFRLSGFGQAGVVHSFTAASAGGDERTAFLDAGLRGERSVVNRRPLDIAIGAGAWAGGQRGSQRLDIGPAATLKTQISGQDIRLNADWRFRIAGNASPGNGPALTLSAGF